MLYMGSQKSRQFVIKKAEQGVSPFQLKDRMGHSSISVTQLYVHMSREHARRAMEQTSL